MKNLLLLLFIHIIVCVNFANGNNSASKLPKLTESEKEYIKNNTFHAITTTTWIPFNFENNKGQVVGIGVEYLKLISKKLDMNVEIHKADNFSEVLRGIKEKKFDFNMVTTKTKSKEEYSIFTKSYERFPISIAVKNDADFIQKTSILEGKKVSVGKNYSAYTLLKKKYPAIDFVQVANTKEAIKLVDKGEVFAAVDILPVL